MRLRVASATREHLLRKPNGGLPISSLVTTDIHDDVKGASVVAIVKMNGQPFGTSNGTVSADNRTMTVDSAFGVGSQPQKTTETWVRK